MDYTTQIEWIRSMQHALRSDWMDLFFRGWAHLDTTGFNLLVIVSVWCLWDRHKGVRLFYILMINALVNKLLKVVFGQPRPCQIDPLVGMLCLPSEGLPSGAAQKAVVLCGFIFIECRRFLYRVYALIFAVLLCFSRVYLGVHFITDIIGGIVVGGGLLLLYQKGFPVFKKHWKVAACVAPFVFLLGLLSVSAYAKLGMVYLLIGVAGGLIVWEKYGIKKAPHFQTRLREWVVVLAGYGIFYAFGYWMPILKPLWTVAFGFWLSFLAGYLTYPKRSLR